MSRTSNLSEAQDESLSDLSVDKLFNDDELLEVCNVAFENEAADEADSVADSSPSPERMFCFFQNIHEIYT